MLPRIPLRLLPPNIITASSLSLGLASIALSFDGHHSQAAWFILWCALIDKADGTVARLMDSRSSFGAQFDSLADLISFGVAPGLLIHSFLSGRPELGVTWAASFTTSLFFILATALRLARFNVTTTSSTPAAEGDVVETYFIGIPSPLAAILVASGLLVSLQYGLLPRLPAMALTAWLVLLGVLMISSLRVPKIRRRGNRAFNAFQLLLAGVLTIAAVMMVLPILPFTLGAVYLVVSVVLHMVNNPGRAPEE